MRAAPAEFYDKRKYGWMSCQWCYGSSKSVDVGHLIGLSDYIQVQHRNLRYICAECIVLLGKAGLLVFETEVASQDVTIAETPTGQVTQESVVSDDGEKVEVDGYEFTF